MKYLSSPLVRKVVWLLLAVFLRAAQFAFAANAHGYMIGQVFFALWVFPLGLLICRSKFIPKFFGVLFLIETVCGLLAVAAHFLLGIGAITDALLLPGTVAEFVFLFFLLIRGVNAPKKAQVAL